MPINIGGKVPWDEIYPEILKSTDLLNSIIDEIFLTKKYGKENHLISWLKSTTFLNMKIKIKKIELSIC